MKQYPSILNDVIGPVMIGPSSSHTAASVRIGRMIRDISKGNILFVKFQFDKRSSIAATYHTQGSDIGLCAGILGYDAYDERILDSLNEVLEKNMKIEFEIGDFGLGHPNTYYTTIVLKDMKEIHLTAISTGGGMFELTEFEGFSVNITGGFYETIIICEEKYKKDILEKLKLDGEHIIVETQNDDGVLLNIKSISKLKPIALENATIYEIDLVLPIKSQVKPYVPFITAEDILINNKNKTIWKAALEYESIRGNISEDEVFEKMLKIVHILKESLKKGKNGTHYEDRILKHQSHLLDDKKMLGGKFMKSVIEYVTLFMEIKSSMGVFVAAPTAGSCGCVPGVIFALQHEHNLSDDDVVRAFLASGLIGIFIANKSTFAAEVCGCQAECGSGSGMCAAACAEIMGGDIKECFSAASMALQNIFGLVCDPVANRVEVPCLGKNILAATNAIACANMAISGFCEVIPLDETIESMYEVGKCIIPQLRCTGMGGLSTTKSALKIRKKLEGF